MNIILIGMPASGKTSAAAELNKLLKDFSLIDIDNEIAETLNMSVNDIFASKGEEYFRKIETQILKKFLKSDRQIIAAGGGIIKSDENIKLFKNNSIVIYLKADIETLFNRAAKSSERPLLNGGRMKEKLENLLKERENKYISSADIIIDVSNITPEKAALEITEKIHEHCKCQN